ncbi:NUDIX hydrolase [Xanthobacter agilis]|uniref:8-oxo-dGTP pyrophosphatase MutT (NUDIX family) n=1 Tax=Xanthobacter agilis TaxID=47492 RepID=A0ABU0L9S0_XANAG|nr:NUDIX hydrolase [Xanthobacter agilis]MDQ0503892.1 8-oxo-dGTP pyrophosphatase MutT (NUDIX family) [Xanthobacter agilis]
MSADPLWGQDDTKDRRVAPVRSVCLTLEDGGWPEAEARQAEIDSHFALRQRANPHLWNGDILLLRDHRFADGHLDGRVRRTTFASFLWWRDQGWPDLGMVNVFALAALEGADGAFLMGVMGAHTASAGRIYFPGGTPDLSDLTTDGHLDLAGSVWRELAEETGLAVADVTRDAGFTAVFDGPRLALLRRLLLPEPAADAARRIHAFLGRETLPELSAMAIVRNVKDISPQMAPFAVAYMRHLWNLAPMAP